MSQIPKEEFWIGETHIIIHSHLVAMTSEERKEWFQNGLKSGNPVVMEIAAAMDNCYK